MKRCIFFICFLFFLTGCNSRTLRCTSTKNINDSSISTKNLELKFRDDKLNKLTMNINVSLSNADNLTKESIQSSIDNSFGSYKDIVGVDYSSIIHNDGFDVKINIDFSKLDKHKKEKISLVNSEKNYEQIKQEFESNGFKCE